MFIVKTQTLENYGAHSDSGRFSDGTAYWKMKGGSDYLVRDLDRPQDAMAFVMAAFGENEIGYKEFPVEVMSLADFREELNGFDEEYREFLYGQVLVVSPKTGREFVKGL